MITPIPSSETTEDKQATKAKEPARAQPTTAQRLTREDQHVRPGQRCEVVTGPHEGITGSILQYEELDKDGYPVTVIVEPDNQTTLLYQVDYKDIRPGDWRLREQDRKNAEAREGKRDKTPENR